MTPDDLQANFYYGGGGSTDATVLSMVVIAIACLLVLILKRRYVIAPFLFAAILVPNNQRIYLAGLNLHLYRILLLCLLLRLVWAVLLTKRDRPERRANPLDRAFVRWAICNAVMYSILWAAFQAFLNRLGFLFAAVSGTLGFWYLIRDREDVLRTIRVLCVLMALIAAAMWSEHSTGTNVMSELGGVQAVSAVRDGKIRAQGPFAHAIVAGTVGAMFLPLFVFLWTEGKRNRLIAALGILSSTVITITSASSTPVMTYGAGVLGLCFWPFRKRMRALRWGFLCLLVALQLAMKVPIWYLIGKVSVYMGGTGFHRSELINAFVFRFQEWWLTGTRNNASWGFDMWDAINAYVRAGLDGGLLAFVLFVWFIVVAYKRIGRARAASEGDAPQERLMWALGVTLFSITVAFFGIIFFDQSVLAWYLVIALISTVTWLALEKKSTEEGAPQRLSFRNLAPATLPGGAKLDERERSPLRRPSSLPVSSNR
jgi:hypothetical protein